MSSPEEWFENWLFVERAENGRWIVRTGLVLSLGVLLGASLWAQESGTRARGPTKENLDLPYSPETEPGAEEEEAVQAIVFYGQEYEGQGVFFCCGTSGVCHT